MGNKTLEGRHIKKKKNIEVNNNEDTGERFCQDKENIPENEANQVDTENLGVEEKTMMQDILDLMKGNSRTELRELIKKNKSYSKTYQS